MIQRVELITKWNGLDIIKFSNKYYSSKGVYIILNKNKFSKHLEDIIRRFDKRIDLELYTEELIELINERLKRKGIYFTMEMINALRKYSVTMIKRGPYIMPGIPKSYVIAIRRLINAIDLLNGEAKEFAEKIAYIIIELTKTLKVLKTNYVTPTVWSIINLISAFPKIPRNPQEFITTPYHLKTLYDLIGIKEPYYLTGTERIITKELP